MINTEEMSSVIIEHFIQFYTYVIVYIYIYIYITTSNLKQTKTFC